MSRSFNRQFCCRSNHIITFLSLLFLLAASLLCPAEIDAQGSQRWTGSGVAIGSRLIVTNYHVVNNAQTLAINILHPSSDRPGDHAGSLP